MIWDNLFSGLIGAVIGSIVGGLITLRVSLYLQKQERKTIYAIQNKQEIYEPLYDEVKEKHKELAKFGNPFNAATTLVTWARLKHSVRLRIPNDLKNLVREFNDIAREYFNACLKANQVLIRHINEKLEAIRNELDEREYSGNNFDILKRNIFEGYTGDFYSGRIFRGEKHNYPLEKILKFRKDSSLTFDIFFNKVCSSIESEEEIIELRRVREELIKITKALEEYLRQKIEFILNKYESKLAKV